jgi:hypothetical protein
MKRLTALLLLPLMLLTSCVTSIDFGVGGVTLADAPVRERNRGYHTSAATDNAQYFFSGGTENEMLETLRKTEMLLTVAKERYNLTTSPHSPMLRVYYAPEGTGTQFNARGNDIILGDDYNRMGAVFFHIGRHILPAWLCVGFELYWADRYGMDTLDFDKSLDVSAWYAEASAKGLPPLGDEWFIPGFIDDELSNDILSVTYAFVSHLEETGEMAGLVELYRREATLRDAERARAALWAGFTGTGANERAYVYRYHYGVEDNTNWHTIEIEFSVFAELGLYLFTPSGWARDIVEYYVDAGEEATRFIAEWLGYNQTRPFRNIYRGAPFNIHGELDLSGGWYIGSRTTVTLLSDITGPPSATAHEIVHAVLSSHPTIHRSNFPISFHWGGGGADFFEEGLCVVIDYLFLDQTENERYAVEMSRHVLQILGSIVIDEDSGQITAAGSLLRGIEEYSDKGGFEDFDDFTAFATEYLINMPEEEKVDGRVSISEIITFIDLSATFGLSHLESEGVPESGERYWQLQAYYTAASFMFYLLEHKGTKEDFFAAYADINRMEEIYGADMAGMIDEWLEYIESRFSGYNNTMEWLNRFFERYMEWFTELEALLTQ